MTAKIPLSWRKNFKDHEANREEWLQKIQNVTGIRFTTEFSPSFDEFLQTVYAKDPNRDRAGETLYKELERDLKDDMVKEAFVEATADKKKIVFELFDGKKISWSMSKVFTITDGCVYLRAEPHLQDIGQYIFETKVENLL